MIGIHIRGYKIIAAVPIEGGEQGHMIVTGQKLRQPGTGHRAQFVTWFTDSNGVFDSPVHFTAHDKVARLLKSEAIGDMIRRSGHMLSALT